MKIDANDPRWTAFALGELEDGKEIAELENALRESEEIRQLVGEIRQTANLLNDGLKSESFAGLSGVQRERIESRAIRRRGWFPARPVWALTGVAAVLALSLSFWMYRVQNRSGRSAAPTARITDLREATGASRAAASVAGPGEVEIATQHLTVVGPEEKNEKAENLSGSSTTVAGNTERERGASVLKEGKDTPVAADLSGVNTGNTGISARVAAPASAATREIPVGQAKPLTGEASASAGAAALQAASGSEADLLNAGEKSKSVAAAEMPQQKPDISGVGISSLELQRDGVAVNDLRYNAATPLEKAVQGNPAFRLVQSPVDTGFGRGGGRPDRPGEPRRRYPGYRPDFNTEGYESIVDNPFLEVVQNPLSTFSIEVDTASYANVRRFLEQDQMPPKDAVRIEELVNYFDYDYRGPGREGPFAAHFEITEAPWNTEHRLLRIGLKAKEISDQQRPPANLVFLIDVSGSMGSPNKLPLVKEALHMLIDRMTPKDRIAVVTYAGSTRVALPSTGGEQKWRLHQAVDRLVSGGSTNGASGIQLAYETARKDFMKDGANRVILATDGDFNVGTTSHGDLARLIEEKADSGIFLSALGFGMGNYKDDTLELLADKGRGNYAYIDNPDEAKKVLVDQINATLVSVAKDVKIQVEFNPEKVGAYRLIGYEDRVMAKEDFNDDAKKAGVIGAGHAVTALYEIVPPGKPIPASKVDPLKYQKPAETTRASSSNEVGTVKIRYKEVNDNYGSEDNNMIAAKRAELEALSSKYTSNHPAVVQAARELEDLQRRFKGSEEEKSKLMEFAVKDSGENFNKASVDFKFAASVAVFGMVLRDSPYKGSATLEDALKWAQEGKGPDRHGYRSDFIRLLHRAISIKR
jgi:Ca-activated chloride channel family protein